MIKKIVVPTDFSEYSNSAVRLATNIAAKANAEVHLIHIVTVPVN